jgi:hypothetical protein
MNLAKEEMLLMHRLFHSLQAWSTKLDLGRLTFNQISQALNPCFHPSYFNGTKARPTPRQDPSLLPPGNQVPFGLQLLLSGSSIMRDATPPSTLPRL